MRPLRRRWLVAGSVLAAAALYALVQLARRSPGGVATLVAGVAILVLLVLRRSAPAGSAPTAGPGAPALAAGVPLAARLELAAGRAIQGAVTPPVRAIYVRFTERGGEPRSLALVAVFERPPRPAERALLERALARVVDAVPAPEGAALHTPVVPGPAPWERAVAPSWEARDPIVYRRGEPGEGSA